MNNFQNFDRFFQNDLITNNVNIIDNILLLYYNYYFYNKCLDSFTVIIVIIKMTKILQK